MGEGDEESFHAAGWRAKRRVFNFQDFLPGHNDFHIQFILTAVI